jgi:cytochrome c-type biogenesis protein CcmE
VITATYTGLVPDTSKSGAEVVAKGSLTADNQLDVVPDGIMAKCPSKYDADKEKKQQAKPGDVAQKL